MKIRINQDIVEFTPENPAEKTELEALWIKMSNCIGKTKRLEPMGTYIPSEDKTATFHIEGLSKEETGAVPKKNLAQFLPFVRRMTRMFTVRRATRPFTSKKARSSPSAAADSWRFSTDYAFPGPFPFCARTGSQHFAGCHFLSAVCRDILVDTLPHISLSVVTFSPRCILLMVWTAVRK